MKIKKIKKFKKMDIWDYLIIIFLSLWGLIILYPFYNSVLVSLTPQHVYTKTPFMLFPKEITFDAYKYVFTSKRIINAMGVTVFVTFFGVIYNMFLTVTTAYALTKPFPGNKFIYSAILLTMYFGGGMIPTYLQIKNLGLINSVFSMILPVGINLMYMMIMMRSFQELPPELEESAKLDGANDIIVFFKIALPLTLPMIATFALYYGVERWNEWWNGMLYINRFDLRPLQLVLREMIQEATDPNSQAERQGKTKIFSEGLKMACVVVSMVPIMCLYPFLQKYFVTGLTIGAVKA